MEKTIKVSALLQLQIEQLGEHSYGNADRIKRLVTGQKDHPSGVRYIAELADRTYWDVDWMQKRFNRTAELQGQREVEILMLKRTWEA